MYGESQILCFLRCNNKLNPIRGLLKQDIIPGSSPKTNLSFRYLTNDPQPEMAINVKDAYEWQMSKSYIVLSWYYSTDPFLGLGTNWYHQSIVKNSVKVWPFGKLLKLTSVRKKQESIVYYLWETGLKALVIKVWYSFSLKILWAGSNTGIHISECRPLKMGYLDSYFIFWP